MRLDAERRREYAGLINDSGHHLLSVVNGILDMSKMETGDFEITPEPFAPAAVIAQLLRPAGVARRARPASSCRCRMRPICPTSSADKRAVKQVLLNLLSNAIKFTDQRRAGVGVRARARRAPGHHGRG